MSGDNPIGRPGALTREEWRAAWRATTTARELAKAEATEARHREALRHKVPVRSESAPDPEPRPPSNVLEV